MPTTPTLKNAGYRQLNSACALSSSRARRFTPLASSSSRREWTLWSRGGVSTLSALVSVTAVPTPEPRFQRSHRSHKPRAVTVTVIAWNFFVMFARGQSRHTHYMRAIWTGSTLGQECAGQYSATADHDISPARDTTSVACPRVARHRRRTPRRSAPMARPSHGAACSTTSRRRVPADPPTQSDFDRSGEKRTKTRSFSCHVGARP